MKFELIGIDYLSNIFTLERTWPLTNRPLALGPICLWLYHFVGVILTSLSFGTIIPRDSARQEEGRKRVTLAKSLLFGSQMQDFLEILLACLLLIGQTESHDRCLLKWGLENKYFTFLFLFWSIFFSFKQKRGLTIDIRPFNLQRHQAASRDFSVLEVLLY